MLEYKEEITSFEELYNLCWSDATDTLDIVEEHTMEEELMDFLYQYFVELPTLTEINDLLRFDGDWVLEKLGIGDDDNE